MQVFASVRFQHNLTTHASTPSSVCPCSAEIVANLRASHAADDGSRMGVDVVRGEAGDMSSLGIYEAFRWGLQNCGVAGAGSTDVMAQGTSCFAA